MLEGGRRGGGAGGRRRGRSPPRGGPVVRGAAVQDAVHGVRRQDPRRQCPLLLGAAQPPFLRCLSPRRRGGGTPGGQAEVQHPFSILQVALPSSGRGREAVRTAEGGGGGGEATADGAGKLGARGDGAGGWGGGGLGAHRGAGGQRVMRVSPVQSQVPLRRRSCNDCK